jgi:hypothetical protein
LLKGWDVGVGVFPQHEEILICSLGFGGVTLYGVSAGKAETRECADDFINYDSTVVTG